MLTRCQACNAINLKYSSDCRKCAVPNYDKKEPLVPIAVAVIIAVGLILYYFA